MSYLTVDNVSHLFFNKSGYTKALNDINCQIESGEFISILGPSGCGKSTLLSIFAGLLEQTSGEVMLEGKPIRQTKQKIGYMLQQDYLFPWKTILDNILIGPKVNKANIEETKEQAIELLNEVGLDHVSTKYPNALSGGMRQRVALVRTLINEPEILLLDEPFSALDYFTKLKLEDLVDKMLKHYEKTAILVTHDIGEAISMSDRILILGKQPGHIVKIINIPTEIRNETPFLCRRHSKYQSVFDKVWSIMNKLENGETVESEVQS